MLIVLDGRAEVDFKADSVFLMPAALQDNNPGLRTVGFLETRNACQPNPNIFQPLFKHKDAHVLTE